MNKKQLILFKNLSAKKNFGGHDRNKKLGIRKTARPISLKKWNHLVLKSSLAKGPYSLLSYTNKVRVENIIKKQARKHGVWISEFVNMGNHLHLKIRPQSRESFQKFLKSTTAMIARAVTGANRNKKFGKFWDGLAFTRVLTSRREELQLKGYFHANRIEAQKGYQARQHYLDQFNLWLKSLKLQT